MNKKLLVLVIFILGVFIGAIGFYFIKQLYDKHESMALYLLAAKEFDNGNLDYSAALLNNALAKNNEQYGGYYLLGVIYHKKGNVDLALKMYTMALGFAGDDENATFDKNRIKNLILDLRTNQGGGPEGK